MLRKWRPTYKCIYVVSDIHGNYNSLKTIIDRVVPLRFHKNQEDYIVFIGDYIDYGDYSDKVLDCLIKIKEQEDRSIFIRGNHEDLFLRASKSEEDFSLWKDNGGFNTIKSYLARYDLERHLNPLNISRNRFFELVPKSHMDFIESTKSNYVLDNYLFFHGGLNSVKETLDNSDNTFIYDRVFSNTFKNSFEYRLSRLNKDNYTYVSSHNDGDIEPYFSPKSFMLECKNRKEMYILELNSMSCCRLRNGKERMYKYDFKINEI